MVMRGDVFVSFGITGGHGGWVVLRPFRFCPLAIRRKALLSRSL